METHLECKTGIVRKHLKGKIEVLMLQHSACSGCHAKGVCSLSDIKERKVLVSEYPAEVSVGDHVILEVKTSLKIKALFFAYLLPLVIILLILFAFSLIGLPEKWVALLCLGGLFLYTLILWLLRGYFQRTMKIRAIKPE